jgi:RHS repeat-associated protein
MTPRRLLSLAVLVLSVLPGQARSDDVVEYYHLDALGNIRIITDEDGDVLERHDFYPFGEECTTGPCASNPGVGAGHPRKFTGKERDVETGLDYFGARYYGSKIGRFTTVDPVYTWNDNLLDPQRWNRYAYGRDNPFRYVDPDGRAAIEIPQGVLARNSAARQAVAAFFGSGQPNQHPHARFGETVADTILSTALPQTEEEYTEAFVATAFGFVAPLQVGSRIGSTRHIKLTKASNGSYTIEFDTGKGYAGKGGTTRARRSGRGLSREHDDPVKDIHHSPAETDTEAFRQEADRLEALGGPKSPNNYNKINSPGKKLNERE